MINVQTGDSRQQRDTRKLRGFERRSLADDEVCMPSRFESLLKRVQPVVQIEPADRVATPPAEDDDDEGPYAAIYARTAKELLDVQISTSDVLDSRANLSNATGRSWKNLRVAASVARSDSPPPVSPNQFSGVIAKAAEGTAARRCPCSSASSTAPIS